MANFHVGQRVRLVETKFSPATQATLKKFLGVRPSRHGIYGPMWEVDPDDFGRKRCLECFMRPLTDPQAERFIESIKKLGREPINDAPKVTVTK